MPSNFADENRALLCEVARAFGDLLDQVVFLGGATTSLLVDEGAEANARKTDDVDVIADLLTTADYYHFAEQLRARGFREDQSDGAPLCRWKVQSQSVTYTVDVMPCTAEVLGFANQWYPEALKHTTPHLLEDGCQIDVVQPLYFLATKFEAYHGRFEGDYYSRDIEDIVFVIEHRKNLAVELLDASGDLRDYLKHEFENLNNPEFRNVLPGLLDNEDSLSVVRRQIELMAKS